MFTHRGSYNSRTHNVRHCQTLSRLMKPRSVNCEFVVAVKRCKIARLIFPNNIGINARYYFIYYILLYIFTTTSSKYISTHIIYIFVKTAPTSENFMVNSRCRQSTCLLRKPASEWRMVLGVHFLPENSVFRCTYNGRQRFALLTLGLLEAGTWNRTKMWLGFSPNPQKDKGIHYQGREKICSMQFKYVWLSLIVFFRTSNTVNNTTQTAGLKLVAPSSVSFTNLILHGHGNAVLDKYIYCQASRFTLGTCFIRVGTRL